MGHVGTAVRLSIVISMEARTTEFRIQLMVVYFYFFVFFL